MRARLQRGIYLIILIIVVQGFSSLVSYLNYDSIEPFDVKEIISQITYVFLYVSLLRVIRQLVAENQKCSDLLQWVIRLEVMKVVSDLLGVFIRAEVGFISSAISLGLLIIYIRLISEIFSSRNKDNAAIVLLKPYFVSLIAVSIIAVGLIVYLTFNAAGLSGGTYALLYYLLSFPYILLIRYFQKMKAFVGEE